MQNVMGFSFDSRPIQTIVNQIKNIDKRDGIDTRPPYQRGFIWSPEFMDKLIFSIIRGYPIGNISLRVRAERNAKGAMQEVVDGQQRLTTIFNFINGDHTIQTECARKIIEYIVLYLENENDKQIEKLKKKLDNKGKIALSFSQLPSIIRENIYAFNISITNITNASEEEITEYFRYLQNQERLRAGEIINSLPDSALEKYLEQINDNDRFLRILTFANNRRQFDRAFYSVLGLLNGQIGYGVLDKEVLQFAANIKHLNKDSENKCIRTINQINHITNDTKIPHNLIKSNTRLLKFFLLTSSLGLVDYTINTYTKLKTLESINGKLSSFNSAKAGEVKRAFAGYSDEVIEEHRLLALISKGGHPLKRVENRIQILAYYINGFENKTKPSGILPI